MNHEESLNFKSLFVPLTNRKAIVFIVILGLIVFSNGLFNGFVGDDQGQIIDNSFIHSILNIPVFFQSSTFFNGNYQLLIGNYFRPLMLTYFATIYHFFGASPFFFHFFQLVLHLANTILLFLFLRYFIKILPALFLSLIFLVHPINSEVVYYISDSQEILFFCFGMLSLLILSKVSLRKYLIFPITFLLLSLVSKETGVLFVILAEAYTILFKRKFLINVLIGGGLSVLLFMVLRIHAVGFFSTPTNSSIASFPIFIRMINIPAMFLYYFKTLFFPLELASNYQWVLTTTSINNFFIPLIFDLIFISLILYPIFVLYKKRSKLFSPYIFFAFWFMLGMSIHMQIIPLDATVAEGWFYFPIVGLLGMVGIILETLKIKLDNKFIVAVGLILILILSSRTIIRSFDWKDEFTLASHDIKVSKDAWALENALSFAYFQKGVYQDSKTHAEKSIKLHPYTINYLNLGASEVYLGNYKAAKEAFLNSIKYGDYYQTYDNLSYLYLLYGDPKENIMFIQGTALKKFPNDPKLWTYLSILEYNFTDKDKAKQDIEHAFTLDPQGQTASVYSAIMSGTPVVIKGRKN